MTFCSSSLGELEGLLDGFSHPFRYRSVAPKSVILLESSVNSSHTDFFFNKMSVTKFQNRESLQIEIIMNLNLTQVINSQYRALDLVKMWRKSDSECSILLEISLSSSCQYTVHMIKEVARIM